MFTPSNMLRKYLNAQPRDMYDIVGALMGYIDADPAFRTSDFDEAVKYVLDHGVSEKELYAEFDPDRGFEEDESKWDKKYYSYARVYLTDNFCRKRIDHVKKVAGKVYPAMPSEIHDVSKPMPAQKQTGQPAAIQQRQTGQPAAVQQRQTGQPTAVQQRQTGQPAAVQQRQTGQPAAIQQRQTGQPTAVQQRQAGQPGTMPQKQTGQPVQAKGRQTEPGKKSQGQTGRKQTTTVPVGVKIIVGLIVIFVGLALMIAFIIG